MAVNELKLIETGPSPKGWPLALCAGAALTLTGLVLFVFLRFSPAASAMPALVGLALLAGPVWRSGNTRYVVTDRRLYRSEGLFFKRSQEMPVALVRDVRVRREGLAAAFGVGDVEVVGAAGGIVFAGVEDPEEIREKILSLR